MSMKHKRRYSEQRKLNSTTQIMKKEESKNMPKSKSFKHAATKIIESINKNRQKHGVEISHFEFHKDGDFTLCRLVGIIDPKRLTVRNAVVYGMTKRRFDDAPDLREGQKYAFRRAVRNLFNEAAALSD